MTIPTLNQLESLPIIRFPPGNRIPYGEDFSFYHGIPADVDWYIASIKNGVVDLVRPGHGVSGYYGNGGLSVFIEHFPGAMSKLSRP